MSRRHETYETTQPWVIYTYGMTHDLWWPPWSSTRVLGYGKIRCTCAICGVSEVLKIKMPRFGAIPGRGHHPARVEFLSRHVHKYQQTAPHSWALPLSNPDAHDQLLEILQDVVESAVRKAAVSSSSEAPRETE